MGELMIPIAFGLVAASLTAVSAGLAVAWRRGIAQTQAAEAQVDATNARARELADTVDDLREQIIGLKQELKLADTDHGKAKLGFKDQRDEWNEQRTSLQADLDRTLKELNRARRDLDESRRDASTKAQRSKARERILASLGLSLAESRNPVAQDERMASRAILRQLLLSTGSEAAALLASSGLVVFGAGRDASMQRLGAASALAGQFEPDLAAVLCSPVAGLTIAGPRFAQHLLRVHGSDRYIAVENMGEAPHFALRHARLALAGSPQAPQASPQMPDHYIDLNDTSDESLKPILTEWAKRWKAQTVTALGHDGRPLAATATADPGAAMGLRQRLRPVTLRAARDRIPLDALSITAWAEDGTTVQVAFTHADLDTAALVSLSAAPLPDRAIEELQSTLRWHLSASAQQTREAS